MTATTDGHESNDVTFQFRNRRSLGGRPPVAEYHADRRRGIVIYHSMTLWWSSTYDSAANAINRLSEFLAEVTKGRGWQAFQAPLGSVTTGNSGGDPPADAPPAVPAAVATVGLQGDLVLSLSGAVGTEMITFDAETPRERFADIINRLRDRTNARAEVSDELRLVSDETNDSSFVELEVIRESESGRFGERVQMLRSHGSSADVSVNGHATWG